MPTAAGRDETRITGRLPHLDLEIRHGRNGDAEWLTLSVRAVPSIEAAARLLDPRLWWQAALAWNPWLAWMQAAGALPQGDPGVSRLPPVGHGPAEGSRSDRSS